MVDLNCPSISLDAVNAWEEHVLLKLLADDQKDSSSDSDGEEMEAEKPVKRNDTESSQLSAQTSCKINAVSLMWLLVAKIASFGELFTSGVVRIDDPGAKIFCYLAQCRGTYERQSTHFQECIESIKQLHEGKIQLGLDCRGMGLPSKKNTILFSRLPDNSLFIKLEEFGCPPFWQRELRNFKNFREWMGHSKGFLYTRFWNTPGGIKVTRKEHTNKQMFDVFVNTLSDWANCEVEPKEKEEMAKKVKEYTKKGKSGGLTVMMNILNTLIEENVKKALEIEDEEQLEEIQRRCEVLSAGVKEFMNEINLDLEKGYKGQRKGKEVTLPGFDLW
eukprot:CAMPEP_0174273576 /NCGR_PEP_ID=MMETSP0439-20130205/55013_1 /TAXON_ID=0 /ORGANISM="Stereomyxa ramosa, Strain Chinc5" /LENGTH=331 /DNA_ID=CAMNT_0015364821 /DNA_START=93 /DNA_END=1085 /DNA_ORIENTATION=+